MNKDSSLLSVHNLHVFFKTDDSEFEAIKGISFNIEKNQTVALVGESGSGKSVTSLATMGLLPKKQARISIDSKILFEGENLLSLSTKALREKCGKEIAMIFQDPMSSLNPVFKVGKQISEILQIHTNLKINKLNLKLFHYLKKLVYPIQKKSITLILINSQEGNNKEL